jgi:hypothetical protein
MNCYLWIGDSTVAISQVGCLEMEIVKGEPNCMQRKRERVDTKRIAEISLQFYSI